VAEAAAGRPSPVTAVHDVGSGGLAVAAAEMAIAADLGAELSGIDGVAEAFCERPGRFLVATPLPNQVLEAAAGYGVPAVMLGKVTRSALVLEGLCDVSVAELAAGRAGAFDAALDAAG
jgi:phosphoribosylformylglycinamidine synthase